MPISTRRPRIWWSRLDSRALEALLGAAFVITALTGVADPLLRILGIRDPDTTRVVEVAPGAAAAVPGAPAGGGPVTLEALDEARLAFTDPSVAQRTLLELPTIAGGALALLVIYLLVRIVRTVHAGDPFVPANARRLGLIATTILVGALLGPAVTTIATGAAVWDTPVAALITPGVTIDAPLAVSGLLTAMLAEVFRRGTRLREDTEGLV
jgi:hypothetical protein